MILHPFTFTYMQSVSILWRSTYSSTLWSTLSSLVSKDGDLSCGIGEEKSERLEDPPLATIGEKYSGLLLTRLEALLWFGVSLP